MSGRLWCFARLTLRLSCSVVNAWSWVGALKAMGGGALERWTFMFAASLYDEEPRMILRGKGEIRLDSFDPVEFCSARLGIVPDPKLAEVLRSTAKRGLLNCSRQWGKSTITAAKAVHRAWTRAGSLVIVASPTERQSAELLTKAATLARRLGVKRRGDGDNKHSLVFPNGSRDSRAAWNGGYRAWVFGRFDNADR